MEQRTDRGTNSMVLYVSDTITFSQHSQQTSLSLRVHDQVPKNIDVLAKY